MRHQFKHRKISDPHVYLVKWCPRIDTIVMDPKYLSYLHKINTILFTTHSATKRDKCHLSNTIIGKVSIFGYVIFFQMAQAATSVCHLKNK